MSTSAKPINERSLLLLKKLIEVYIREGQPVGSKTLGEEMALSLSPATIRNIMADLEEAGYIHSPHTSAGRIPTVQGYRFFVDHILTCQQTQSFDSQELKRHLSEAADKHVLLAKTSSLLSNLTSLAGVVTLPKRQRVILRQVEFLPLSQSRILAVLVTNEYEVENRIIFTKRAYTASELQQAGNFLTQNFMGKELFEVRQALFEALRHDRESMEEMMQTVMDMAEKVFAKPAQEDYVIAGESNLLTMAEETGVNRLQRLFEAFNEKREMLNLFDQCLEAQGVQIFIGEEAGYQAFDACSVVTAPYHVDGDVVGVLGVIGPTRMPYERVISLVDITAKLLSAAFNDKNA